MAAIQHRDWQEVDEPEIYREQSKQLNELGKADAGLLAGNLRNFYRAAKIFHRAPSGNDLDEPIDHRASHSIGVDRSIGNQLQHRRANIDPPLAHDAKAADDEGLTEAVALLLGP